MKKMLLVLFCYAITQNINAQSYLIEQGSSESLLITDVSTNRFDVITKHAFGIFSGYEIIGDSLICFFNKRGRLSTRKFHIGSKYDLLEMPKKLAPDYDSCHWNIRIHKYKDYRLILGKGAVLCQKGKVIWSVNNENPNCAAKDTSNYYYLHGYISPQLSPDETSIVFHLRSLGLWISSDWIIEIDFKTGIKRKIGKGVNPCYSPDGKYILYKDDVYNWYHIYDKSKHKKKRVCESGVAFWLYK